MATKQNKHKNNFTKNQLNKKRVKQSNVRSVTPKTNFQFSVNLKHLTLKIYIREKKLIIKKTDKILLQCLEIMTTQCRVQWSNFHLR